LLTGRGEVICMKTWTGRREIVLFKPKGGKKTDS